MTKPDYHAHLDVCEQCREHPFALCETGALILEAEVAGEGAELVRENEKHGVHPDDAVAKLHEALDANPPPIAPGSIRAAPAVCEALIAKAQAELTMEHLLEAERKLREANVPYLEPVIGGHYYALVHAESPAGRAMMHLRQLVARLVRRERYVGGRKARSAKRRLERIARCLPAIVHAERMGISKMGVVIEWDCARDDEPSYDSEPYETRVSSP